MNRVLAITVGANLLRFIAEIISTPIVTSGARLSDYPSVSNILSHVVDVLGRLLFFRRPWSLFRFEIGSAL